MKAEWFFVAITRLANEKDTKEMDEVNIPQSRASAGSGEGSSSGGGWNSSKGSKPGELRLCQKVPSFESGLNQASLGPLGLEAAG